MPPLSDAEKLSILNHSGLRVDDNGRVSNWLNQPPQHPRPIGQNDEGSATTRRQFTAQEDEMLKNWCTAAEMEGIKGNCVFEQFEAVCPNHPWQAYQTRWRKTLRSTTRPNVAPDDPYPGLNRADADDSPTENDTETETIPEILVEQELKEPEDVSYNDFRIDSDRVVFEKLSVKNESELRQFLRSQWVVTVYSEFCAAAQADDLSLRCLTTDNCNSVSRSPHLWKLEQALCVLELPGTASRYGSESPDQTSWTEDDHDIHFIVRAARLGSVNGQVWCKDRRLYGWGGPCRSALWLLLWFKWIRKTTTGQSDWTQRIQKKREMWLSFIESLVVESRSGNDTAAPTGSNGTGQSIGSQQQKDRPISGRSHAEVRQKLDQQLFLLSTHARDLYSRNRDNRLSAWGIGTRHEGTCVLLPASWAAIDPASLVEHTEAWPTEGLQTSRLYLPMGAFTFPWARAAAWFEQWPRSTEELQHFVPPNDSRQNSSDMHGSHLCHHGLCINPTHLVYEGRTKNLSRNTCANAAAVLRSYDARVPKHCSKHDPPCLLQLAALTTFETFAMQFNILRLAKDIDGREPYQQPASHPPGYLTFEQGPMASAAFPDVGIRASEIIRLPNQVSIDTQRGFQWSCALCTYPRTFKRITSFWAHLRAGHQDTHQRIVLREVTRSAQANQAWAHQHFYQYQRQNPVTWQKLVQAQAADFTWEVFASWRLSRERQYQGRIEQQPDNTA